MILRTLSISVPLRLIVVKQPSHGDLRCFLEHADVHVVPFAVKSNVELRYNVTQITFFIRSIFRTVKQIILYTEVIVIQKLYRATSNCIF